MVSLLLAAALAKFFDIKYGLPDLNKISGSLFWVAVLYFVFQIFLDVVIFRRIKNAKTRYSFKKANQALFILVSALLILRIWIIDPQVLVVAYGLIAAGVAISLQDVFKNFAGTIIIFLASPYRVGDRIEINGKFGDVIDIGILYTSLLELREWIGGDQPTGRISIVPNGHVLTQVVNNYTKDHDFIWDEFTFPVTYGSDWRRASILMLEIVKKTTQETTKNAERQIFSLEEKYYLSKRNIEPMVFVVPTDNWIQLNIRYVVNTRSRRLVKNELLSSILSAIEHEDGIKIASQTFTISGSPTIKT